jgi:single-stranded-DNA-specific exonuclease
MEKRWVFIDKPQETLVEELRKAINVNPVLAVVLAQRGISSYDEAKSFFRPDLSDLYDPFLMKDMDLAVDRLSRAIESRERILVYGDYDVDGTTSVTLVYGFLNKYSKEIDIYLPDRYTEGYGISEQGIKCAIDNEVNLIIALDCGIRANRMITMAKDAGIDVIICDHHIPGNKLPPAMAILDPKQEDCPYPFKELSGCGIGFKLLQGYCLKRGKGFDELSQHLDLVAVSIAADIVPIVDENRTLAFFGLKNLNDSPGHGLKALIKKAGLSSDIDVSGVVFGIAPRINAAGRMRHANDAVWLLLADTKEKATELSETIQDQNTKRKSVDQETTQIALKLIEQDKAYSNAKSTVVYESTWHKGVIGIVASRLIETHYRPTIVLTESNGKATGSARSVRGFNIYKAIGQCSDLLEQFGGHAYAAGLTLSIDNIPEFKKRFDEAVQTTITDEQLIPQIQIDHILEFERIDHKFFKILNQMAPFGPGNPSPIFLSEDVTCASSKIMKAEHLKLWLRQKGSKRTMEAVAFRMADLHSEIMNGNPFNIAYHIESNEYNGERSIQLVIKDIKFTKDYGLDIKG